MKKIAITGAAAQDRMLLAQALSYVTGYDMVRQTAYSCQAIKYDLNKTIEDCNWSELYTYALSSFSERIETEQYYDRYISNGSVFHELTFMEALTKSHLYNERKSLEYASMYSVVSKVVTEYAIREYDCIIHIGGTFEDGEIYQRQDSCLRGLIQGCRKRILVDEDFVLSDILEKITTDLGVNPILSPKAAVNKAQLMQ